MSHHPAPAADCLFRTDAELPLPALVAARRHAGGCACPLHARRRVMGGLAGASAGLALGGAAMWPALAQAREGVDVGPRSKAADLVPADQIERAASQQYGQLVQQARAKNALALSGHPQLVRLNYIAERIRPFCNEWNPRAQGWRWEVNLLGSKELNAFCMPGGKIAFYWGILTQLQLNDDEVAMIMGHETAHALREHARERMGKQSLTQLGIGLGAAILGLGSAGRQLADMGGQLLTLKYSRDDETEADLVGLELAARAGYDPGAGLTLWQKMEEASKGAPPQFLSTHPSSPTRMRTIEQNLPKVQPLFERAPKPERRFGPPGVPAGAASGAAAGTGRANGG